MFCQKLATLMGHDFIARMQAQFLQEVNSSLDEHEFHVVGDFAENYAFVVQDASQSFHWNNAKATSFKHARHPDSDETVERSAQFHNINGHSSDSTEHDVTTATIPTTNCNVL